MEQLYGKDLTSEEVFADVCGQLFGNQEFIINLSTTKPSIFRRIYNKIVELANKITGNSNEALFIRDLKNKWENAYRTQNNNLDGTNYSFMSEKGLNNALQTNKNNINVVNRLSKAKQLKQQGLDNESIRQRTLWFQDPNGKWLFEITDKDANFTKQLEPNKKYRLSEIFSHDKLFEAYPELKNMKIKTINIKPSKTGEIYGGQYDQLTKTLELNNDFLDKNKTIRNILLHEMQHRIQSIEKLEKGDVGKNLIRYYTSLGEIQSSEVETRSNMDYAEIKANAPEISKSNPVHPLLKKMHNEPNSRTAIKAMQNKEVAKLYNEIYNKGIEGEYNRAEINKKGDIQTQKSTKKGILYNNGRWGNNTNSRQKSIQIEEGLDNSSFSYDNQGRKLTKEQQEYFKDSKVRDEKGRLLEVYHGTNEEFTVFDRSYIGSTSGDLGFLGDGFYFATHSGEASYYGGKNMATYLNVTNPYNIKNLQKYKGVSLRGENSNPYLEIKNLVDMNPEWGNIKLNYGNTYEDVAREVTKIIDNIKVEEAGRTADGYKQFRTEVNGKINFVSTIDSYTANEVLGDTLNKEMRDVFGYISSNEVLQNITSEAQIRKLNNQEPIKTFSELLQEQGYDGIFQGDTASYTDEIVVFNPNQIKNVDNTNPTSNEDIRYSQNNNRWQEHLEKNYKATGTRTMFSDMKSNATKQTENNNTKTQTKKVMNPLEISKITKQDSNTTPILPKVKVSTGDGESKFASNIRNKTNMLSESSKDTILSSDDVRFYEKVTNQESLEKAFERLNKGGKSETENWLRKESENATSVDVAEGWILLKQYQDSIAKETDTNTKNELNRSMVEVAKKLREIGTKVGQTVPAFNILNRLTPEGMVYYAQSELSEAYEKMLQNKTKEWIDSNRDRFELMIMQVKIKNLIKHLNH